MNPIAKRIAGVMMAVGMVCALVPATSVHAEEYLPEWVQDPDYHEVALLQAQDDLPARFDLRDNGVVTPIRLQNPWSSCWAFAGIAAAETSIISDLGAPATLDLSEKHLAWYGMHTVNELDAGDQAGEGITVFAEGADGGNAVYIPSNPVLVSTLFSAGVGPVYEYDTDGIIGFPYRGSAGITDLDVFSKNEYKPLWKGYREKELIKIYGSEEKVLAAIMEVTSFTSIDAYLEDEYVRKGKDLKVNSYSGIDDWSIPDVNEAGESNRNLFVGYTLRHGNQLPSIKADDNVLNQQGMQAVKQELMDGHGVSVAFCADTSAPNEQDKSDFINRANWAHYTYKSENANHGVCIVGWDDNYPATNFTHGIDKVDEATAAKLTTPPGNGAWIAKNSWGCSDGCGTAINDDSQVLGKDDWGIDGSGFFYISYYDQTLMVPESLEFDDDLDGDEFISHVYDYLPSIAGFYYLSSSDAISSANVFAAEEDEQVVSVSTRSAAPNSRVTFALYELNDNAQDPTDGTLVETQSYDIEYQGFHRFDLTEPLKVRKGQKFSVVSTVSHIADGQRVYDISASRAVGMEKAQKMSYPYYGTAVVNEGESAFYANGKWQDWSDYQQNSSQFLDNVNGDVVDNFSIKAYALLWDESVYACVEGDGATWTQGSEDGLTFTFEDTVKKGQPMFDHATVDDADIDQAATVVGSANMVTSLSAEFLSSLEEGAHSLTVYFDDGEPVKAAFTIAASEQSGVPESTSTSGSSDSANGSTTKSATPSTGDVVSVLPAAFLLAAGAVLLLLRRRARKDN